MESVAGFRFEQATRLMCKFWHCATAMPPPTLSAFVPTPTYDQALPSTQHLPLFFENGAAGSKAHRYLSFFVLDLLILVLGLFLASSTYQRQAIEALSTRPLAYLAWFQHLLRHNAIIDHVSFPASLDRNGIVERRSAILHATIKYRITHGYYRNALVKSTRHSANLASALHTCTNRTKRVGLLLSTCQNELAEMKLQLDSTSTLMQEKQCQIQILEQTLHLERQKIADCLGMLSLEHTDIQLPTLSSEEDKLDCDSQARAPAVAQTGFEEVLQMLITSCRALSTAVCQATKEKSNLTSQLAALRLSSDEQIAKLKAENDGSEKEGLRLSMQKKMDAAQQNFQAMLDDKENQQSVLRHENDRLQACLEIRNIMTPQPSPPLQHDNRLAHGDLQTKVDNLVKRNAKLEKANDGMREHNDELCKKLRDRNDASVKKTTELHKENKDLQTRLSDKEDESTKQRASLRNEVEELHKTLEAKDRLLLKQNPSLVHGDDINSATHPGSAQHLSSASEIKFLLRPLLERLAKDPACADDVTRAKRLSGSVRLAETVEIVMKALRSRQIPSRWSDEYEERECHGSVRPMSPDSSFTKIKDTPPSNDASTTTSTAPSFEQASTIVRPSSPQERLGDPKSSATNAPAATKSSTFASWSDRMFLPYGPCPTIGAASRSFHVVPPPADRCSGQPLQKAASFPATSTPANTDYPTPRLTPEQKQAQEAFAAQAHAFFKSTALTPVKAGPKMKHGIWTPPPTPSRQSMQQQQPGPSRSFPQTTYHSGSPLVGLGINSEQAMPTAATSKTPLPPPRKAPRSENTGKQHTTPAQQPTTASNTHDKQDPSTEHATMMQSKWAPRPSIKHVVATAQARQSFKNAVWSRAGPATKDTKSAQ